jgi:hypothetical protein
MTRSKLTRLRHKPCVQLLYGELTPALGVCLRAMGSAPRRLFIGCNGTPGAAPLFVHGLYTWKIQVASPVRLPVLLW